MTLNERRMVIAYADMIQVSDLIQHVMRIGAYEMLTADGRQALADADEAICKVKNEMMEYTFAHLDNGTSNKENKEKEDEHRGSNV